MMRGILLGAFLIGFFCVEDVLVDAIMRFNVRTDSSMSNGCQVVVVSMGRLFQGTVQQERALPPALKFSVTAGNEDSARLHPISSSHACNLQVRSGT